MTFYGYPDNAVNGNSGTNVIAYARQWQGHSRHTNAQSDPVAGGIRTFDDSVTAAAGQGNSLLPPARWCTCPA